MDASSSNKRLPRADAQRNYDLLIKAATKMFKLNGADTSLDSIAHEAGVGIGTVYRHFPNRQALAEALFGQWLHDLRLKADEYSATLEPASALETWLKMLLDVSVTFRGMKGTLLIEAVDPDSELVRKQQAMYQGGRTLLKSAQVSGDVRKDVTIDDVMEIVHALSLSDAKVTSAERLLSLLLSGLWVREKSS